MKISTTLLYITLLITGSINTCAQTVFPLKISENKRYLVDQRNVPVPVLGRTAWCIISQPVSGYRQFIGHTLSFGYNAIEMSVICHWPLGNHPPFNGRGEVPFNKRLDGAAWDGKLVYKDTSAEAPDLTTPNERYWSYVDSLLAYCESRKVLVLFFPGYVGYAGGDQGWMQELLANGTDKTQAYGEWIAKRYTHQKNIIWMLLGDMGKFTPEQIKVEAALIKGLKSVPGQQSVFYSAEANSGQNSTDQVDFGHEMTLNGTYNWEHPIASLGRRAYAYEPVMPAYLLEEPYDEEGPDGNNYNKNAVQPVRRFQWWGWLSTIGGYVAGNGYIWPFIDPVWDKHLNTNGAKDMQRLNKFIKSIRWWQLVPSGLNNMKQLIVEGGSCDTCKDYVAAAANHGGTLLVAYIPPAHTGSITVDMTALKSGVSARWYDPANGSSIKIPGSPFDNKGTHSFTPPGSNSAGQQDWVLVLEKPVKK